LYRFSKVRILHQYFFCILLILFASSTESSAQWQKVFQFPTAARTIYFLDQLGHPEVGFAGLNDGSIWRTRDFGTTWDNEFQDLSQLSISDISFKDNLTGWFCTAPYFGQNGASSVYRTTDGGFTWKNINSDAGGSFTAIYYFQAQQTLYLSEWGRGAFTSHDDGDTWNLLTTESPLNGYAFSDSKNGILTYAGAAPNNSYTTNDGGIIWQHIFSGAQAWQPAAKQGTTTFFIFSEYNSTLTRTDGIGFPWQTISTIGSGASQDFTGCLRISSCNGQLYVQSSVLNNGLFMSSDEGITWQSIGGPSNEVDSRFGIDGVDVYAADKFGALWVNRGIRDTIIIAPQLTFFQLKKNASIASGKDTNVIFSFQEDISSSVGLDSFAFDLSFNSNMLNLDSSNAVLGWKITVNKTNQGLYHCMLYNPLHEDITANQPVVFFYFSSYLTKDIASSVLLQNAIPFFDSLNNTGCMIALIPQNSMNDDSVIIHAVDTCGDPILRSFLITGFLDTRITLIHPNPASNEIAIETESPTQREFDVSIYDDLGKIYLTEKHILQGQSTLRLPIQNLPSGIYHIELRSSSGSVSSEFIKIH
jgi:hypothetical protein